MLSLWQLPILAMTTLYQALTCYQENQQPPPGQLIDVGDHRLHLMHLPSKNAAMNAAIAPQPTVVIDHSLGGVEGYLLAEMIAPLAAVCWCDRAGYGWSDVSRRSPTSAHQVTSLNTALIQAHIKPPYILIGNSLGSYHMRLYAHHFPGKVVGMVLTDGLHEKALLKMPWPLRTLQLIFFSGFVISILGSALGIIRLAAALGLFKAIKPQLQQFPTAHLKPILRSFSRPKHWLTMAREIAQLNVSGHQLQVANDLGNLPIINIKARYFFKPSWLTKWLPSASIEAIRDKMHRDLMGLSTQCIQLSADKSSHFVWTDQPDVIVHAVQRLLTPA